VHVCSCPLFSPIQSVLLDWALHLHHSGLASIFILAFETIRHAHRASSSQDRLSSVDDRLDLSLRSILTHSVSLIPPRRSPTPLDISICATGADDDSLCLSLDIRYSYFHTLVPCSSHCIFSSHVMVLCFGANPRRIK